MKIKVNPADYHDLLKMSRYLHDFTVWEYRPRIWVDRWFPFIHISLTHPVSLNLDHPLLNYVCHLYTGEAEVHVGDAIVIDPGVPPAYRHEETEPYPERK
jgi:hypothetical protein